MEIRPILSAMWRNKTGSVLVALQIALTLAIVVNCLFMAKARLDFVTRPSGMDLDNIVTVTSTGFGGEYDHQVTVTKDLELLRALPGVIGVTSTRNVPMSGSGSAEGFKASLDEDAPVLSANYYYFDDQAFKALGVSLAEGRNFRPEEVRFNEPGNYVEMPSVVILTKAYAERLFPGEAALGKTIYDGLNRPSEIVGIVEHMFGAWVSWSDFDSVLWFPQRPSAPLTRYIIRAEPGQRDRLVPLLEQRLSEASRNRLLRVRSMEEVVSRSYESDRTIAVLLIVAIVLLLVITSLGIVGLASFSVRQRTKQIGTRRAVGARKIDIIRYFLTENWLMTTIGIALGTVLTIALNFFLAGLFDVERLDISYLLIGMLLLWCLGFLSVAGPSRRAAKVSPAVATRTV